MPVRSFWRRAPTSTGGPKLGAPPQLGAHANCSRTRSRVTGACAVWPPGSVGVAGLFLWGRFCAVSTRARTATRSSSAPEQGNSISKWQSPRGRIGPGAGGGFPQACAHTHTHTYTRLRCQKHPQALVTPRRSDYGLGEKFRGQNEEG